MQRDNKDNLASVANLVFAGVAGSIFMEMPVRAALVLICSLIMFSIITRD